MSLDFNYDEGDALRRTAGRRRISPGTAAAIRDRLDAVRRRAYQIADREKGLTTAPGGVPKPRASFRARLWKGTQFAGGTVLTDAVLGSIFSLQNAGVESRAWAARTGRAESGYVGWKYGLASEAIPSAISTAGALVGSAFGLPGAIVGGVGGYIAGRSGLADLIWKHGMPNGQSWHGAGMREWFRLEERHALHSSARRRIQFGGDFRDSREAQTMRQRAVQEISGGLASARQYLGNEASFLH